MTQKELAVSPAEEGLKLLRFLEKRLNLPQAMLHRWIRGGQCRINGKRSSPFDALRAGDLVRVPPFAGKISGTAPKNGLDPVDPVLGPIKDDRLRLAGIEPDLLVLCKKPGLSAQPGSGHEKDSVSARLADFFARNSFIPAPAHRLDKQSSGLILAGRSHKAQQWLHSLFAGKSADAAGNGLEKNYYAWVEGRWPENERRLEDEIFPETGPDGRQRMRLGPDLERKAAEGRRALCLAEPLRVIERAVCREGNAPVQFQATLLRVSLITGRKHQIRAQCAGRGHPIVGDRRYSAQNDARTLALTDGSILLHAFSLRLPDGRVFSCPPDWPEDWSV